MLNMSASVGGLVGLHNPLLKRRDQVGFCYLQVELAGG